MNILVVSNGYPTAKYPLYGIFELDQARALADAGHHVIFAAVDMRSIRRWRKWGYGFFEKDGMEIGTINVPVGAVPWKLKGFVGNLAFRSLYRRISKKYGRPDLIHAHFSECALNVVETCKRENIPYVVTEHSSAVNRDDLNGAEIARIRYVYQNASAVVAVSRALAKRIEYYSGVKAVVIPNIIDFSVFSAERKPHEGFRFVSAGCLNTRKGFDVLLAAFRKCTVSGMKAELLIMGDGPERKPLENLVKEFGMTQQVRFFGEYARSQFAEELSRSDTFVLASRSETFGVVYAEAMAGGLPVIATRCGGPEDFVDESSGLLVNVDDIDALAEAMMVMYKGSSSYNGAEISRCAKERFSGDHIAGELTKVFRKAVHEETV